MQIEIRSPDAKPYSLAHTDSTQETWPNSNIRESGIFLCNKPKQVCGMDEWPRFSSVHNSCAIIALQTFLWAWWMFYLHGNVSANTRSKHKAVVKTLVHQLSHRVGWKICPSGVSSLVLWALQCSTVHRGDKPCTFTWWWPWFKGSPVPEAAYFSTVFLKPILNYVCR